jgi:ABC-type dipeptide/oligopeptide/nickel transport system ATPase component
MGYTVTKKLSVSLCVSLRRFADRIAVMENGVIVEQARLLTVFPTAAHLRQADGQ